MERQPSYVSEGIIGQLYRRASVANLSTTCECRKCTAQNLKRLSRWQRRVLTGAQITVREEVYDPSRGRPVFGKYGMAGPGVRAAPDGGRGSGLDLFGGYKAELRGLMARYKLKNEESLFFSRDACAARDMRRVAVCYSARLKNVDVGEVADRCLAAKSMLIAWSGLAIPQTGCAAGNPAIVRRAEATVFSTAT